MDKFMVVEKTACEMMKMLVTAFSPLPVIQNVCSPGLVNHEYVVKLKQ